jgi:hypothetical protein
MSADYLTKRVAVLKEYLGIANKRPEVVAREEEALRLFRHPGRRRPKGKTGPELRGDISYEEIGRRRAGARDGRSRRWLHREPPSRGASRPPPLMARAATSTEDEQMTVDLIDPTATPSGAACEECERVGGW